MPEFYHAPALTDPQNGRARIFIATPASAIYGNHFAAVVRSLPLLMIDGFAVDHFLLTGHAHVDDARNTCVGHFLETECDELIFIDADIGFPAEALVMMARHTGDVVAGVYPRRDFPRSWPVKFEEGANPQPGEDGVMRSGIAGLPTGFMKIHRRVLKAMAEIEPRFFHAAGDGETGPKCPVIFERDFNGLDRMSGDYTFCRKAKLLGFELALDPHLPFTHEGPWRFAGRLADDMKQPEEQTQ